jgi:hypothetical protein
LPSYCFGLPERFLQKIRRREKVIRIFPNIDSAYRLVGALCAETHEWRPMKSGQRGVGTWTWMSTSSGEPIVQSGTPPTKRVCSTKNELLNQPPYLPKLKIRQNAGYTILGP